MKSFGETLYAWLDDLDLGVTEFAIICGKHPNYLGSLKRGKNKGGAAGIGRPTLRVQEQIFAGIESAFLKRRNRTVHMDAETFYAGPPLKEETATEPDATIAAPTLASTPPTALAPKRDPKIDLAAILTAPNLAWYARDISETEAKQIHAMLAAFLSA